MTDRDHFAAAALTGLLAQGDDGSFSEESYARAAYRWADAMLRERERTNHDAAPAARATEKPASSAACQSVGTDKAEPLTGNGGTGDTQKPVAWAVVLEDGERIYDVYDTEEEAKAVDEAVTGNHGFVPLFRSPALTDAEREALNKMRVHLYEISRDNAFIDEVCDDAKAACEAIAAFLNRYK